MAMTEDEIVREYRMAKYKKEQVQILADLNCTDRGAIEQILRRAGEDVPEKKRYRKRPAWHKRRKPVPKRAQMEAVLEMERLDREIAGLEKQYLAAAAKVKTMG